MNLDWKLVSEEPYRAGYRKMLRRNYLLPNQRQEVFDIKDEHVAVCVLALTPDRQVILAKQFRPGPGKVLCELPGGGMEADELPIEAMQRELLEETGYSGKLEFTGTSYQDAYSTMVRHNFVATDCMQTHHQQLDQNESIETTVMSLDDFMVLLKSGELTDSTTAYKGLDYLNLI